MTDLAKLGDFDFCVQGMERLRVLHEKSMALQRLTDDERHEIEAIHAEAKRRNIGNYQAMG